MTSYSNVNTPLTVHLHFNDSHPAAPITDRGNPVGDMTLTNHRSYTLGYKISNWDLQTLRIIYTDIDRPVSVVYVDKCEDFYVKT